MGGRGTRSRRAPSRVGGAVQRHGRRRAASAGQQGAWRLVGKSGAITNYGYGGGGLCGLQGPHPGAAARTPARKRGAGPRKGAGGGGMPGGQAGPGRRSGAPVPGSMCSDAGGAGFRGARKSSAGRPAPCRSSSTAARPGTAGPESARRQRKKPGRDVPKQPAPTRGGRGRPPARTERPCAPGIMVAALSRQGSARAGSSAGKTAY